MKWLKYWFWAPVRENENWAQTLVRVGGNLLRSVTTIVVLSIAVIASLEAVQNSRYREQRSEEEKLLVEVNARVGGDYGNGCPSEFPVAITVRNLSKQTLMKMDILVTARESGTSINVLEYPGNNLQWDSIVPPQYQMTLCYTLGRRATADLVYSAETSTLSTQMQQTEKWMLLETKAVPISHPLARAK